MKIQLASRRCIIVKFQAYTITAFQYCIDIYVFYNNACLR